MTTLAKDSTEIKRSDAAGSATDAAISPPGPAEALQVILWKWKHRAKAALSRLATFRPGLGAVARDVLEFRLGRASDWIAAGTEIQFGIDATGEWDLPQKPVTITGWCHPSAGQITAIRAIVNTEIHDGYYGAEHIEAAEKLPGPPDPPTIGFSVQCCVQWGYNHIVLEAFSDGRWVPVCRSMRRAAYFPMVRPQIWNRYGNYVEHEQRRLSMMREDYAAQSAAFPLQPLISLVMPVYKSNLEYLQKAIDSIRRQIYSNWELCIVDDGSARPELSQFLESLKSDPKIKLKALDRNVNISAATNEGISMAVGDFIAFVDHDDELAPDALFHIAAAINRRPDCELLYTDQDKIDSHGSRSEPFFKPDWSPAYFRGVMYLGHLMVVRRTLLADVNRCDSRFDGAHDFDLGLRLSERTKNIEHIPRVLYHWRAIAGSLAADESAKTGIDLLQERAVQAHLDRVGIAAVARRSGYGHRVNLSPSPRKDHPKISILIPTRDHPELIGRCLQTLFHLTSYPNFEVIVGDNETRDPQALAIIQSHPVRRVALPGPFHFARFINTLAAEAQGDFFLLLNNDTEIVQPDWLDYLLLYAQEPDVGAVGPLLTYADGSVQHAGVILGPRGTADHVMRGFPADCDGYMGSLPCSREVTAVTAAATMVGREKFLATGGFCERYHRHYDDLDFCLQLRRQGLRNIFVATARLIHHESRSRGDRYDFTDRVLLLDRWQPRFDRGDEYYNRNFDPESTDYRVGTGAER